MIERLENKISSFIIGDYVDVESRTTPGINKPGGAGRIKTINNDGTYCVNYILGGREDNINIKYIKKREDIDGRPQRKRVSTNINEIKSTDIKEIKQKKIKKIKKTIKIKKNDSKDVVDESCPYLGLDDVSSIVDSEEDLEEQEEEQEDEEQEQEQQSISPPPPSSPLLPSSPSSQSNKQSDNLTNISLTIFESLFDAIRHCKETSDGGYLFNDIQKYLLEHITNCTINDVEDAIKYAESMNKFMIIVDNDTNIRLLYPID